VRALVQRVSQARVEIEGEVVAEIAAGLLVLFAAGRRDTAEDLNYLVRKVVNLRIFADDTGKMNRSLLDVGGEVLVVSQFTLYADTRKGNRPSFTGAADPDEGRRWYDRFVESLLHQGVHVETGRFGAHMRVALVNDGPVTVWIDSSEGKRSRRTG